jgi:hypothetical protein
VYGKAAGLCLATALFICGVAGFPTPPSSVPASTGTLVLSTNGHGQVPTFTPGALIQLEGGGFADEASVTVAVYSRPTSLAQTVADGSGRVDVEVRLPRDLSPGRHTLVALGVGPEGQGVALTAPIRVANANAAAQLAYTGFDVLTYLAAGIFMVVLGLVLLRTGVMRRRLMPVRAGDGE